MSRLSVEIPAEVLEVIGPEGPGVWKQALAVARAVARGVEIKAKKTWIRQMLRIAKLPDEIGADLDRRGVSKRRVRVVAYGSTRLEQRKRWEELCAELDKPKELPLARRVSLVKRLGVTLPPSLQQVPPEELEEFLSGVAAALQKKRAA